jgi:hypothetical protein
MKMINTYNTRLVVHDDDDDDDEEEEGDDGDGEDVNFGVV